MVYGVIMSMKLRPSADLATNRKSVGSEGERPFLLSGRIGSDRSVNFVWGLSVLGGKILPPSDVAVERKRYAVDLQYYYGSFALVGEFAFGRGFGSSTGNDSDVRQLIAEFNWRAPRETVLGWLQIVHRNVEENISRDMIVGTEWHLSRRITASVQLTRTLEPTTSNNYLLQLRYRY